MKSRKPARIVSFRVYCGPQPGSGKFVYVRVFDTQQAMLAAIHAEEKSRGSSLTGCDTLAQMHTYKSSKYPRVIGCVNLNREHLGTEVITHEFGHAMFAWGERKGIKHQGRRDTAAEIMIEEELCYTLGRMASRFVTRAYKLGLYTE